MPSGIEILDFDLELVGLKLADGEDDVLTENRLGEGEGECELEYELLLEIELLLTNSSVTTLANTLLDVDPVTLGLSLPPKDPLGE